jgi:hypothetical protein
MISESMKSSQMSWIRQEPVKASKASPQGYIEDFELKDFI